MPALCCLFLKQKSEPGFPKNPLSPPSTSLQDLLPQLIKGYVLGIYFKPGTVVITSDAMINKTSTINLALVEVWLGKPILHQ